MEPITTSPIPQPVFWNQLNEQQQAVLLDRPVQKTSVQLRQQVELILQKVQQSGDEALCDFTAQFDGVALDSPILPMERVRKQAEKLAGNVKSAIDQAFDNIARFHEAQRPQNTEIETSPGIICQQRFTALQRVGLYIPGGTASLPSTVLMLGVPAMLAGCEQRVLISPPDQQGLLSPAICYAALKCGVTQVCLGGGAQAIGALAFGTESIPAVDKIFGPGNSYVTEAKQQVSQVAGGPAIDLPAGPSELLVIADKTADPDFVAADLLSQAEHGADSQVLLLTPSETQVNNVREALQRQLAQLPRADIAQQALRASSLIVTDTLGDAVTISDRYAPEHLSLQTDSAEQLLEQVRNAGSVFVGHYTPESGGDYATGTNHVLPTYGFARNYNSLGLLDFYRRFTVQQASARGLQELGNTIVALAEEEQLDAHARAVSLRLSSNRFERDRSAQERLVQESAEQQPDAKGMALSNADTGCDSKSSAPGVYDLLRPHLLKFTPYASARRILSKGQNKAGTNAGNNTSGDSQIWLNANESPYADPYQVDTNGLNRYPDFQSEQLNQAYADYAGVNADQVISHRGSDESIELLIRSFCEPDSGRNQADGILICPPTYGMYAVSAGINNNPVYDVPLVNGQLDLNGIANVLDKVKVIFLCSPSNPLGNTLNRDDIKRVLDMAKGKALVVVDEAYIEFSETEHSETASWVDEIDNYDNLVVTRTLSKAFGLASIRMGFTLANAELIDLLKRVLAPYPLPDTSVQIAIQALEPESISRMRNNVLRILEQRQQLTEWLEQQPWAQRVYPSDTNFILVQTRDAEAIMRQASDNGILLRNQSAQRGLQQCVRITVGSPEENKKLYEVLGS